MSDGNICSQIDPARGLFGRFPFTQKGLLNFLFPPNMVFGWGCASFFLNPDGLGTEPYPPSRRVSGKSSDSIPLVEFIQGVISLCLCWWKQFLFRSVNFLTSQRPSLASFPTGDLGIHLVVSLERKANNLDPRLLTSGVTEYRP